jgi:hypothetical protein
VNATSKSVQDNSNAQMQCCVLYAVASLLVTHNTAESLFYVCNRTYNCTLNYQKNLVGIGDNQTTQITGSIFLYYQLKFCNKGSIIKPSTMVKPTNYVQDTRILNLKCPNRQSYSTLNLGCQCVKNYRPQSVHRLLLRGYLGQHMWTFIIIQHLPAR